MTLQERIDNLVVQHGSLRAVATAIGLNVGYLSRLRSDGKTEPTDYALRRLGLRRIVTYEALAAHQPTKEPQR